MVNGPRLLTGSLARHTGTGQECILPLLPCPSGPPLCQCRANVVSKLDRFWSKVKSGSSHQCWPWQSYVSPNGYGYISLGPRKWRVHRLAWVLSFGPIPGRLLVRHKCDNKICCNPSHLELGTHADNSRDCVERGQTRRGSDHHKAKLTAAQVGYIRAEHRAGTTQQDLAAMFGVAHQTIGSVVRRQNWKWL